MLDIHTHVLPDVDDGCHGLEQSIQMIRAEVENGVSHIVCTPHYRLNYKKTPDELLEAFNELKEAVKKENIPVELFLGQEVSCKEDVRALLRNKEVLTLNDSKFVLIELDLFNSCEANEIVYALAIEGYKPIVAHIERYPYIDIFEVQAIRQAGGLIQVNADSIAGVNKKHYWKYIKSLFKNGLVDFVASDIHYERENVMAKARSIVEKKFGEDASKVVFELGKKFICK